MKKKLKHGLIGCGGCGEYKHLVSYARYPEEVELGAVYGSDPIKAKALAGKYKIPTVYSTWEELLADPSIDVVSIVTPNYLHAQITIAALEAGKHVHVEKPISMNAQEAQAIVEAKNRSGKLVMVALNHRFEANAQYAKRYVEEGHLGEIYHARCGWQRRNGHNLFGKWFSDKELSGGGALIDLGVHFLDLTLYWMGFPAPVSVTASCYDKLAHPPIGQGVENSIMIGKNKAKPGSKFTVEDIAVGFAKFETGASVAFEFNWGSHIERENKYIQLLGTKGGITLQNGSFKCFGEVAGELVDIVPQLGGGAAWGENETRYFIDCIKEGKTPLSSPEDAVKMMQIVDATYASAKSGREVIIKK